MSKALNNKIQLTDTDIMQKIFEADPDAVKILYEKYSALLYTLVKKIVKDAELAEEVLIDVFLIIQKRINYFDFNTRNPYTWLTTLAKNSAVYELRKKEGRIDNISGDREEEYVIPRLSHISESLEIEKVNGQKKKIEDALHKLTDAQQYVIYLAYYEGLTQGEIAEKLKIPHSTVESKIKTSLINLNENFKGKASLFTVTNEVVELIYPFVLGCFDYEKQIKIYDRFKASEPFPWKLLGEYQNLVSLLPLILELESPSEKAHEKFLNKVYHHKSIKKEDKAKKFERVSSASADINTGEEKNENIFEENAVKSNAPSVGKGVSNLEKGDKAEREVRKKLDDFEPVIPLKPGAEEGKGKTNRKAYKKNYTSVLIFILILLFIITAVLAYLFYNDRMLYYETEIENLTGRMESVTREFQSRPEIPGLGELRNINTVKLSGSNVNSEGEIIFSYSDKRGYLHIMNLPILDSDNAYQLWGNFKGDFISLGVFKVSSRPDYYPFTLPEYINEGPVEFYLIESHAAGSRRPGSKIYLQGGTE